MKERTNDYTNHHEPSEPDHRDTDISQMMSVPTRYGNDLILNAYRDPSYAKSGDAETQDPEKRAMRFAQAISGGIAEKFNGMEGSVIDQLGFQENHGSSWQQQFFHSVDFTNTLRDIGEKRITQGLLKEDEQDIESGRRILLAAVRGGEALQGELDFSKNMTTIQGQLAVATHQGYTYENNDAYRQKVDVYLEAMGNLIPLELKDEQLFQQMKDGLDRHTEKYASRIAEDEQRAELEPVH